MIYLEDVESIVKNLIGNNKGEFSRDKILDTLKNECTYKPKGRSSVLIFNLNEVWDNYFMKNKKLRTIIKKRKIVSIEELMQYSENTEY
ncbi:hypothetical protein [Clostridium magnum]|uniref:Uncharacterized protein n=1 Tax=Clostridium magnum DSM 2767 TaxID=1121326 RepID=A0A162STW9_9CLOT|nr:hypothetical protein [Clostridium magnum]KZL91861.1 hypothetical protein CLMAG_16670 [Clostridium magnum DSM 2767]SHI25524.1 hypothetical protein SAMN02745944_03651 [Clostridium magnum DSM 2767]